MKLTSIKLCNFRQFYGKTPDIKIASEQKNTTIVHGNNGAGKTTLLNAFTWVLYEQFTAAFASPTQLVNKRAISEVAVNYSVECWVKIYFEHESRYYQVKRACYAYQNLQGEVEYTETKFLMLTAGDDGRWEPPTQQPTDIIGRILPESLHRYFFFDGERIDHIFRGEQKGKIAEDTKELLGVKVLDRAIEHLKKAKRTLQDELNKIGDVTTQKLFKEQKKLERKWDSLQSRQGKITRELKGYAQLKKNASQRLIELSSATKLQQLKQNLEAQEKSLRNQLIESKKNLKQRLSTQGYTIFLSHTINQFREIIDSLRQKGELPTGIKQQFVQRLLLQKRCICGTELIVDTLPYQQVEQWKQKAGTADIEETAIRMETQVEELEKQVLEFWKLVDREQQTLEEGRRKLAGIENDLDDVKQNLRTYPNEDIQNLQKELDEIEETIRELTIEQGGNHQEQEQISKKIESITNKLTKQKLKGEKQALVQRRIEATQMSIERLIEVRKRLETEFRFSLEKRVQEIFNAISFTPYLPRLSAEYELTLIENTSGLAVSVPASTGENQILSLSFIGAIIDRVREWSQKNTLMGPDSSTFPMVMDSPFGSLDEIYRRQVAQSLPKLANQLIILVTQTQWRGEVATEITNYIGQEYVLCYHSSKEDCEEDSLEIRGVIYPLVKRSETQFEYTEVIEVH